jgi:hypothetical protein
MALLHAARIGERIGAGAGAVEHAAARLDVLVHLGDLPAHALNLTNCAAERLALRDVAHRLLEGALGKTERDEATLGVEGGEQLAESVFTLFSRTGLPKRWFCKVRRLAEMDFDQTVDRFIGSVCKIRYWMSRFNVKS